MEYVTLNNGVKMPMVGLGTHTLPVDNMERIIGMAYDMGYRKLDTAWLYKNEESIGNAIKSLGIDRRELFMTTKLHIDDLYYPVGYHRRLPIHIPLKSVRKAFENSCKRLRTDYIDLYLIHWPFDGYQYLWEDVVNLYEKGRIKAIGVSSFLEPHLNKLFEFSSIIPSVNQYEINPFNNRAKLNFFCKKNGIHVEAYATFGTTFVNDVASEKILNHNLIFEIAENNKKTASQIILRWTIQNGISVIPRSKSKIHLRENIEIFDFELSNEEIKKIDSLNEDRFSRGNPYSTLK